MRTILAAATMLAAIGSVSAKPYLDVAGAKEACKDSSVVPANLADQCLLEVSVIHKDWLRVRLGGRAHMVMFWTDGTERIEDLVRKFPLLESFRVEFPD